MTPSNLYAMRAYAEHPIGLWPIDDELTFLSLIKPADRVLSSWTSNATIEPIVADGSPFDDTSYRISGNYQTVVEDGTTYYYYEITSPDLFNFNEMNAEQKVFSINVYLYHQIPASFYEVGYQYTDGQNVDFIERVAAGRPNEWIRVGKTYDPELADRSARVFIRVFFRTSESLSVIVNGLSIGQWSETTSATSLGIYPVDVPRSTGIPSCLNADVKGIELREYGNGLDTAYALIQDNKMLASNGGIPIVYGSGSTTVLNSSSDDGTKLPSVVVPGKGFLNGRGRYADYTLETWLRLKTNNDQPQRIIGPLESNDGLYVHDRTLSLVIGSSFGSYCVGEWYRPMLVHVTLKAGEASVLINGEKVISIPYDPNTVKLPMSTGYSNDWIGFYSWSNMDIFEIDTVSIYPYVVPQEVAKRRFVWGQGVESPESINSAHLGTPHYVDFAYAGYQTNHSYPEAARWDTGVADNLNSSRYGLTAPDYKLPVIESGRRPMTEIMSRSRSQWLESGGDTFITFGSDSYIDPTHMFFESANVIIGQERSFYVSCSGTDQQAPIFTFVNKHTGGTFECLLNNGELSYSFNGNSLATRQVSGDFVAGVDFVDLPDDVVDYFRDSDSIELYVGGYQDQTYTGKIYRIGFCNNLRQLPAVSLEGIIDPESQLNDFIASYTLLPVSAFGLYFMDIAIFGTWSSSYPMGYFDSDGSPEFIQFDMAASGVQAFMSFSDLGSPRHGLRPARIDPDAFGVIDARNMSDYTQKSLRIENKGIVMLPKVDMTTITMTLNLEVTIHGIRKEAFKLKDMSMASVSLPPSFMEMGTPFGHDIAPYSKVGNYYVNTIEKPWTIGKQTAPYLYLTDDSGVHPLSFETPQESGLWLTMNRNRHRDFKVSALQLWVKYSEPNIPDEPRELFSVKTDRAHIKFMCVDDGTGTRAKVYSVDGKTGADYIDLSFHQDGDDVILPYIQKDRWTSIGIDFIPLLDLSLDIGGICLLSSCVFNNIVFYQTSALQEQYTYVYRTWAEVLTDGQEVFPWSYWSTTFNGGATWDDVAKSVRMAHGLSIDHIYKTYVGTNRFVVDSDSSIQLGNSRSTVISSAIGTKSEQSFTTIAVTNHPDWLTLTKKPN